MNLLVFTLAAGLTATATAGQSTIDLHFEGGTVQQWVAAIKSVSPNDLTPLVGPHCMRE